MFSNWVVRFKQSDPWFVEGFSTFYGVYLFDQIYNETLLMSIVVQARRVDFEYTQAFSEYDFPMQKHTFLQNVTFNKMWKEKAFTIFYMMNNLFRKQDVFYNFIFEKAVHTYNTSTSSETYNDQSVFKNIWDYLTFVPTINDDIYVKNINIKNVITSWITHDGYPVVQVQRVQLDTQFLEIKVQDCVAVKQKNLCAYKWWIPVIYFKISRKKYSTNYVYLKPNGKSFFIANIEDDFIIITAHNGYRVNYDHKTLENIALFLKSEKPEIWNVNELSDVTLAHILDDAFYFLIQNTKYNVHPAAKNNNIEIFFNLASNIIVYMKNSYITWYPVLTALQYISKIFPYPETAFMKTKILKLLNIFLEDTSHKNFSENSMSNQVYHELVKWTCILDGVKCEEHVNAILMWHLENPVKNKLLPSWQKWIYCQSLILVNATSDLWQNIEKIYSTDNKKEQLFELLSCNRHNILQVFREIEANLLTKRKSVYVLFDSVAKYSKDVTLLNSIRSRILTFAGDNFFAVIIFIINNTYSEENLVKV
ncbi:aminopeptidase N-like [Pseudomyrmex gracilis]|uniref:aminopeptidase N-like n=1 Tax=Pseudomyrmex gracilis TaxID=219809 RepID=UPI0009957BC2|nr:aminopeptidase N-like [Pseudomyrmex gracilis]